MIYYHSTFGWFKGHRKQNLGTFIYLKFHVQVLKRERQRQRETEWATETIYFEVSPFFWILVSANHMQLWFLALQSTLFFIHWGGKCMPQVLFFLNSFPLITNWFMILSHDSSTLECSFQLIYFTRLAFL